MKHGGSVRACGLCTFDRLNIHLMQLIWRNTRMMVGIGLPRKVKLRCRRERELNCRARRAAAQEGNERAAAGGPGGEASALLGAEQHLGAGVVQADSISPREDSEQMEEGGIGACCMLDND